MNGVRKPNSMLIELVIVILFFSISASIILQLFVAAHDRTVQSSTDTAAVMISEDFAERYAASGLPMEDFLAEDGFTLSDGAYEKELTVDTRPLRMVVEGETESTATGALDVLSLTVHDGGRLAVSFPIQRYLPEEETP